MNGASRRTFKVKFLTCNVLFSHRKTWFVVCEVYAYAMMQTIVLSANKHKNLRLKIIIFIWKFILKQSIAATTITTTAM